MKTKKPSQTERRNFLKTLGGATVAMAALPAFASGQVQAPPRKAAAKYMGDFAAPKIPKVRIALIGVGARGSGHATQLASIEGTEIVAIRVQFLGAPPAEVSAQDATAEPTPLADSDIPF